MKGRSGRATCAEGAPRPPLSPRRNWIPNMISRGITMKVTIAFPDPARQITSQYPHDSFPAFCAVFILENGFGAMRQRRMLLPPNLPGDAHPSFMWKIGPLTISPPIQVAWREGSRAPKPREFVACLRQQTAVENWQAENTTPGADRRARRCVAVRKLAILPEWKASAPPPVRVGVRRLQ